MTDVDVSLNGQRQRQPYTCRVKHVGDDLESEVQLIQGVPHDTRWETTLFKESVWTEPYGLFFYFIFEFNFYLSESGDILLAKIFESYDYFFDKIVMI